eukprot:scaffold25283_cov93-Phaeocystis_antarctica.AAC.1
MACGEASVCPDASLGRRVIGRPSRCALSAGACPVLVPRLIIEDGAHGCPSCPRAVIHTPPHNKRRRPRL